MQPVFRKRWQTRVALLLLGVAVIAVATLSINESEPEYEKRAPQPASRILGEFPTPDLSLAGFRVGSLAVSLVSDLFSGTQSMSQSSIGEAAPGGSDSSSGTPHTSTPQTLIGSSSPTTKPVSPINEPETSNRNSTPSTTQATVTSAVATTVPPSTTTVAPSTTTVAPSTTMVAPSTTTGFVSDEPTEESFEPEQEEQVIVFGQPYLDSWPSLEMWERMAWCESRQTWDVDTGNGYFGGLQFALGSWQWMGGEGSPADAGKEEQIYRANLLWQAQGWNGWPGCKQYFGWSRWQVRE
ncbi:MAG: hypothetical protein CL458_09420 [Acidimicrobiaceae bacterium]|nr:hypothetical protein [Acidimicrobiaceae bacterium]